MKTIKLPKAKCCKCNQFAVWQNGAAIDIINSFFCDEHVSRGCSCRVIYPPNIDEINVPLDFEYKEQLDSKGRLIPCIEYEYSKFGFEDCSNRTIYKIRKYDKFYIVSKKQYKKYKKLHKNKKYFEFEISRLNDKGIYHHETLLSYYVFKCDLIIKMFYVNGQLHKEDGPAYQYGNRFNYYLNGRLLSVNTDKELKHYIKMKVFM